MFRNLCSPFLWHLLMDFIEFRQDGDSCGEDRTIFRQTVNPNTTCPSALDLTCQTAAYAGKGCCNNNCYKNGLKENVWTVKV